MNRKEKILIVDDDPRHLQTTREILELDGFAVTTHGTPFRTTEMVMKTRPDLLLLDINMPGLSGEKLCSLLQPLRTTSSLVIFFYSSNDEDSLRRAVSACGADGYVCKGDIAGLRRRIAQSLAA